MIGVLYQKSHKYLKGSCKEDRAWLFSVAPNDRKRGNVHKLEYQKLNVNVGKTLNVGHRYLLDGILGDIQNFGH